MADEVIEQKVETPAAPEVKPKAETIADIIAVDPKPEPKLVPEAALLEEKKGRKAAEKQVKALQDQIASGATDTQESWPRKTGQGVKWISA